MSMQEIFHFPLHIHTLVSLLLCAWETELHELHRLPLTSSWLWPMERMQEMCMGKKHEIRLFSPWLTFAKQQGSGCATLPKARAPVWHPSPITTTTSKAIVKFFSGFQYSSRFRSKTVSPSSYC